MDQDIAWLLKEKYNGNESEAFVADCKRLKNGEPLAYVIGHIPFLNTTIYLDSRPLIPRTETEYWVEKVITEMRARKLPTINVLDLCAGSGCIGVAVLKNIPNAHVDFVEIDTHHHATIQKNVDANHIESTRTIILGGDLFEHVTDQYDYILSNPPYIDPNPHTVDESVRNNEPARALFGGIHGFEVIDSIMQNASDFLIKNGALVIEHEPTQCDRITAKAHEVGFRSDTRLDQYMIPRYTILNRADSSFMAQ